MIFFGTYNKILLMPKNNDMQRDEHFSLKG